jgi:hypothetical protein
MIESFVIALREGVEATLGLIVIAIKKSGRRGLERPVYLGVAANTGAHAVFLHLGLEHRF